MEKVLYCSCDIIRKLGGRNEEGCSDSDAQSIKATQLQAEKLVQQFDVDSDGVIDVKEFEVRVRGEKHVRSNEVKIYMYIYIYLKSHLAMPLPSPSERFAMPVDAAQERGLERVAWMDFFRDLLIRFTVFGGSNSEAASLRCCGSLQRG